MSLRRTRTVLKDVARYVHHSFKYMIDCMKLACNDCIDDVEIPAPAQGGHSRLYGSQNTHRSEVDTTNKLPVTRVGYKSRISSEVCTREAGAKTCAERMLIKSIKECCSYLDVYSIPNLEGFVQGNVGVEVGIPACASKQRAAGQTWCSRREGLRKQ